MHDVPLQHSAFDAHAAFKGLHVWHCPARHESLQHSAFDAHAAFRGLHA
jgi:hypothetical protein